MNLEPICSCLFADEVFSKNSHSANMRFTLLILSQVFAQSHQISDPNCLRSNPGVLDAYFGLYNSYQRRFYVTKEDVAQHTELFLTRFKRANQHINFRSGETKLFGDGLFLSPSAKKNFQLFLRPFPRYQVNHKRTAVDVYKLYYDHLMKIKSKTDGIKFGFYVPIQEKSHQKQLKAVEEVFGVKGNSTFSIGASLVGFPNGFMEKFDAGYFRRLDFVTTKFYGSEALNKSSPEASADEILQKCREFRDVLNFNEITAEIMCVVAYSSFGPPSSEDSRSYSVSKFQRFWCKIVNEVMKDSSLPQIVMESAFDERDDNSDEAVLLATGSHEGWWRRRYAKSYEPTAFIEKVDELEEGQENRNCTADCGFCISSEECCGQGDCQIDISSQPFEWEVPRRNVCLTLMDECVPRIPTNPTNVDFSERTTAPSTSDAVNTMRTRFYIAVSILSLLLLVASIIAFFVWRRGKSSKVLTQQEIRRFFDGSSSVQTRSNSGPIDTNRMVDDLPYNKTLELSKDAFEIYEDKLLGSGTFGVVVKGRVFFDEAAVKTTLPGVEKLYLMALLTELKVLMYLEQHDNIVNLLGAHTPQLNSGKFYLFLELCPMGNLLDFLRTNRPCFQEAKVVKETVEYENANQLTCKHLLQWSIQIARAMGHLANKMVVHADIAARNILVFSMDQVKLTDFGLSRRLYEYSNYVKSKQAPLPWRHMSLEALEDLSFSVQSDVWSFGVTVWEIFTLGKVPYPGHSWSIDFVDLLDNGLRLQCPKHAHPIIYEIMNSCWTKDVKSRPLISLLESKLTSALNELFTNRNYIQVPDIK